MGDRYRGQSHRQVKKEGINKNDLGREGFLKEAWKWKDEYGTRIIKQLHKLGSSADWDRERFTMDAGCSEAVLEVFTRLMKRIYLAGIQDHQLVSGLQDIHLRC